MQTSLPKATAALCACIMATAAAQAQTYPSRAVHTVVAYAPGGTGDYVARLLSDKLATALGQSVIVENRSGASGAIGAQAVTHAAPDGYTLLVGQTAEIAINQHFLKSLNYDPDKDLMPIALAAIVPLALTAPAKAEYSTMAEFLAALKSKPRLTFASAGTGTPGYFAGELLKLKFDENLTHVPYKGAGPALTDLIGGHVDIYFPGFPAVIPHVKAKSLKMLAMSSAKRTLAAPDVPTVAEATGIGDFDFTLWVGYFAPRGTPQPVIAKLNKTINAVITEPEVKAKLNAAGAEVNPMTVEQFRQFVHNESGKYLRVIKQVGATSD